MEYDTRMKYKWTCEIDHYEIKAQLRHRINDESKKAYQKSAATASCRSGVAAAVRLARLGYPSHGVALGSEVAIGLRA